jgi:hypothetical protein
MEEYKRLDIDPVLSEIAKGILEDEARHLAFNHIYLEDRFSERFQQSNEGGVSFSERLRQRLKMVLANIPAVFDALSADMKEIGMDREAIFARLSQEAMQRLDRSVNAGADVAAGKISGKDDEKSQRAAQIAANPN